MKSRFGHENKPPTRVRPVSAFFGSGHARTMQYVLGMLDGVDARAKLIGILPTMYEPRRLLSGDQLAELLKLGNVLPPIPRSVVASEAVLARRSIVAYAPKSPVSIAYQALAVRIQKALFKCTTEDSQRAATLQETNVRS